MLSTIDIIRTIRDPEEPGNLEELKMVSEDFVSIKSKKDHSSKRLPNRLEDSKEGFPVIQITWAPTNPDCKCALTIALCIRTKLFQQLSV